MHFCQLCSDHVFSSAHSILNLAHNELPRLQNFIFRHQIVILIIWEHNSLWRIYCFANESTVLVFVSENWATFSNNASKQWRKTGLKWSWWKITKINCWYNLNRMCSDMIKARWRYNETNGKTKKNVLHWKMQIHNQYEFKCFHSLHPGSFLRLAVIRQKWRTSLLSGQNLVSPYFIILIFFINRFHWSLFMSVCGFYKYMTNNKY